MLVKHASAASPGLITLVPSVCVATTRREKFNQPIFGCNNIDGECSPLPGTDGVTKFKLSFMEGETPLSLVRV